MTWVAIATTRRSLLERDIWVPDYGADQHCFLHAGHQRAVRRHCEEFAVLMEAGTIEPTAPLRWVRESDDTWILEAQTDHG